QPGHRPLRPVARRLRLHARVRRGPGLDRQSRPVHLRRHHRDHEGNHRPQPRPVAPNWSAAKSVVPVPNPMLDGTSWCLPETLSDAHLIFQAGAALSMEAAKTARLVRIGTIMAPTEY